MAVTDMPELATLPSNRRFGLTFRVVFLVLGSYAAIKGHSVAACLVLFAPSFPFGVIAVTAPQLLSPLNKVWFRFGELLGRIVSPVLLGVIYFGILTPIAFLTRLLGRDELRLRRRTDPSYWVDRNPPGPTGGSFTHQF